MNVAAILQAHGLVPNVPSPRQEVGTAQTLVASHVPTVPTVPTEKSRGTAKTAKATPATTTTTTSTTDARKGFLGLGGFLAQSSLDRRTSPTLRGRWIMINLLCTHPPSPPQNVPKIEMAAGMTDLSKGNVRAILEKHRTDPNCANCHTGADGSTACQAMKRRAACDSSSG